MDLSPWHRRAALRALRGGRLIACPTEAVWGLSCDPHNALAVERLLALKKRPWEKGLILVAASLEQLMPYIDIPSGKALKRATLTWPGPATWIFPATDFTPMWISGDHDGVAVRVTRHPVLLALCQAFGRPMVSTSANPAGREPARSAFEVRRYFEVGAEGEVDTLVPGALSGLAKPTTIRDAATGHILRR
ncbi:L-threonylcarbamoyladenylate synthase [Solimonas aquatica]|uniref:Threonylcarbamoyl-AMP synthase n=1 Tax=Solimonas aquatica TaxID=489703 RepID=A0A1H9F4I8_9GAMM|nr:Sua5/YciO/YrdC/YwlC family protein [Solimonas aquatica]SEQ32821.1 L-threonylcarbamoyladenylate synthase [Solimonas aquatica]